MKAKSPFYFIAMILRTNAVSKIFETPVRTLNFHCKKKTNKFRFEKGIFLSNADPLQTQIYSINCHVLRKSSLFCTRAELILRDRFRIGMDNNCVSLWGRHNCKSQVNWSLLFCADLWNQLLGFQTILIYVQQFLHY